MLEVVALLALYFGWVFILIGVHESGHYLAGRLAGIAGNAMRIRLLCFPQHVVLRDADRWVSPKEIEQYVELVWQYLETKPRVYVYVAGGLALETLFTFVVGTACLLAAWDKMALVLVGLSLLMILPWLVIDFVMVWRGRIFGDLSGLWLLAPVPTAVLIGVVLASRIVLLWYAASTR